MSDSADPPDPPPARRKKENGLGKLIMISPSMRGLIIEIRKYLGKDSPREDERIVEEALRQYYASLQRPPKNDYTPDRYH